MTGHTHRRRAFTEGQASPLGECASSTERQAVDRPCSAPRAGWVGASAHAGAPESAPCREKRGERTAQWGLWFRVPCGGLEAVCT